MPLRNGRTAFLELLVDEGVTHLFGNPGTTELAIMEVVPDFAALKFVLGLQEAIVIGMADGYARASGRLAAATSTSRRASATRWARSTTRSSPTRRSS